MTTGPAHALWIGGPPGAGKTALATTVARRHGLRWYGADTCTWEHRDRAIRAGDAAAIRWEAQTPAERWRESPAGLLAGSLHQQRGPMVVDDVRALPPSPLVVAEGTPVAPGLVDRERAIWLLPTVDVVHARLDERGLPPGPALLYRLLGDEIRVEVARHDAPALRIEAGTGLDAVVAVVEERFATAIAAGPRAESATERRALLREANASIVDQLRGYYARPWADGEADGVVRAFLCECGDADCTAWVEVTVAKAEAGLVLAPGHG